MTMRWCSTSEDELSAIPTYRANSFRVRWLVPSAMFDEMDIAARNSWLRADAYMGERMSLQALSTFNESACAFRQTSNFLKSDMPQCAVRATKNPHLQRSPGNLSFAQALRGSANERLPGKSWRCRSSVAWAANP